MFWPFDPAKNAIPRWCTGRRWYILMALMRGNRVGGNWQMKWDELKKFPWYTHRLMHRKRVTSELYDSYFRLMTIKHILISKIEWASNDNITQLSSTSEFSSGASWIEDRTELVFQASWRRNVVGKATPGRGRPREPRWSLGTWEADHPAEWAPRPPVEHQKNEKTQCDGYKFGVKKFQLCSVSNSLSHANLEQPFSNPCNKVRGNILLKKSSCVCLCHCVLIIVSLWCCRWVYNK